MPYYHFLIDLSLSNRAFQQHAVYQRLINQIDHLIELNRNRDVQDQVGFTFFANTIIQSKNQVSLEDLRDLMARPFDFHSGSAILDSIAKSTSLIEEQFKAYDGEKNLLIFSDFEENASTFYAVETLAEIIQEFSNRFSWNFYAFGLKKSQVELFLRMNFSSENLILLPD
jgi:hypothetical protein